MQQFQWIILYGAVFGTGYYFCTFEVDAGSRIFQKKKKNMKFAFPI